MANSVHDLRRSLEREHRGVEGVVGDTVRRQGTSQLLTTATIMAVVGIAAVFLALSLRPNVDVSDDDPLFQLF